MKRIKSVVVLVVVLVLGQSVPAQLRIARPESVSVSSAALARMDELIAADIEKKLLPGAVVLVGRKDRIVWRKAYGARALEPAREAMTLDTIFDLASLTKVVATATSIMILVERGKVNLDSSVTRYIPQLSGKGRESVTIEHLLTHVSGYAPDFDLKERWTGYDEGIERLIREPLLNPPGTRFAY
ncbi:MAG TPA: serine hydrolase domain-containing protein, partial [Pyrinomonadaceae bacterium]